MINYCFETTSCPHCSARFTVLSIEDKPVAELTVMTLEKSKYCPKCGKALDVAPEYCIEPEDFWVVSRVEKNGVRYYRTKEALSEATAMDWTEKFADAERYDCSNAMHVAAFRKAEAFHVIMHGEFLSGPL